MTHLDKGRFAKKHGTECKPDPEIAAAVKARAIGGEISCADAFLVVTQLGVNPSEVGLAIDCQEIGIVKCQLGLYGYKPGRSIVESAAEVDADMEAAIRQGLAAGRLPCATSWQIAERFEIPKMRVSSACERLGIRISQCQLGAF